MSSGDRGFESISLQRRVLCEPGSNPSAPLSAYLKSGGKLEKAAAMANHASTRMTQLYDRRRDELSLDAVERIAI